MLDFQADVIHEWGDWVSGQTFACSRLRRHALSMQQQHEVAQLVAIQCEQFDETVHIRLLPVDKRTLADMLKTTKLTRAMLNQLLADLLVLVERCTKYMLHFDCLLLTPETIYVQAQPLAFSFVHIPFIPDEQRTDADRLFQLCMRLRRFADHEADAHLQFACSLTAHIPFSSDLFLRTLLKNGQDEKRINPEMVTLAPDNLRKRTFWQRLVQRFTGVKQVTPEVSLPQVAARDMQQRTQLIARPPSAEARHEERDAILYERASGQMHRISPIPFLLGRDNERANLNLQDCTCSRIHAELMRMDGIWSVTDLGSSNGTKVNGETLEAYQCRFLHDGDELTFGKSEFTFMKGGDEIANGTSVPRTERSLSSTQNDW